MRFPYAYASAGTIHSFIDSFVDAGVEKKRDRLTRGTLIISLFFKTSSSPQCLSYGLDERMNEN